MDKLTAIKIKYDDGTYSDEIPVSVLSKNVEWDSTHTLVDVLGSIDADVTGTIQDQISRLFNEKVSTSEYNNLVNKVNNLIALPDGATKADAELVDIRLKTNGIVAATAGNAVREQFTELKNDLTRLNDGGLILKDNVIAENVTDWLDEHPEATTTVQDGSIKEEKINASFLPWIKNDYVTPQMFGAKGDGVTDDTTAIQSAIDSGKIVIIPNGTYMLSAPLSVTHDVRVVCGEYAQFKMLNNLTRLLEVGVTIDGDTNPVFTGLIKCMWDGGIFWGANDKYTATDVIYTERTYVSEFKNITVVNVVRNGIHIAGSIGAWALFENCAVRGRSGNGTRGFLIERSDQHIVNCSVVDCLHGFETNANNILFERCTAWMATDTNWKSTICFYLGGAYNVVSNCVIDTMYFGIRFKSNFKYGLASNISWINNSDIVADVTGMTLLSTDSPSDSNLVKFKVNGITVDNFGQTVRFKRDVSNAIETQITNIIINNATVANVVDFYNAGIYSENKTYTQGTGTMYAESVNGGLHIRWHADLRNVQPSDPIILTDRWRFPELANKCLPVSCLNTNSGNQVDEGAVWVSANGTLQFVLNGTTTHNLTVDLDFITKRVSL